MTDSIQVLSKRWEPAQLIAAKYKVIERVSRWSHNNQISLSCRDGEQEHSAFVLAHGDAIAPSRVDGVIVHQDSDFNGFLAAHNETYFRQIWDHLSEEFGAVFRMRLMKLEPKASLSFHEDFFRRIHIPIITNDRSFFFMNEGNQIPWLTDDIRVPGIQTYHLPADGRMYLVDTTRHHTVYNGGKTDRVHLVCSIP
ncbi:hypothetical protein AMJ86_07810 [bacterium SM23_57]|nr:MAG: hypothetical protein AMJ86_07810 [bacterium SM23_57]